MEVNKIMMPLAIFSVFLHVLVDGYPADDVPKSTSWAPGWGVLIDRPTTAPPPSGRGWGSLVEKSGESATPGRSTATSLTSGIGWGSLIDRSGQDEDSTANFIILNSSSPKMRPAEAACQNWISLDPAKTAPHIIGGKKVVEGDYPHIGALIGEEGRGEVVLCGSSLISEKFILTAAHCVNDPLRLPKFVRFGVINWRNVKDAIDFKILAKNIHIPSEYRSSRSSYDIAVIELEEEVKFSRYLKPACVHTNTDDLDSDIQLAVLGWGIKNVTTRDVSDDLLMTNVSTVAFSDCTERFAKIGTLTIYKGQYCASDPQRVNDACTADSGGPLEFFENLISTITGIVSFGNWCGSNLPSIYSRVAFYMNWIEDIVWPNGVVFNNTLYKNERNVI